MADDDLKYRKRLFILTLLRLGGLAIAMLGLAAFYTDLLRPGGWPQVGAILIITGVIDAVIAPRMMKRQWDKEDQAGR